jgi:hypothetical protein
MGFGAVLWRRHAWPWFALGGLLMLLAAAVPFNKFGLLPGNGGEVILQFAFVSTAYRLSSGWRPLREPSEIKKVSDTFFY